MTPRVVREERGLTLVELLIGSVLMVVVMGAAFTGLAQFESTSSRNVSQNEAQDKARLAIDLMVKRLRNDAAPTPRNPQGIERAAAHDLIFQSVDPNPLANESQNAHNVMRVRYCLDTSDPANGKIWVQQQRWTSAAPPAVATSAVCPDPGWGDQRVLVDRVTNVRAGADRPIWTIDCPAGYAAATCAAGTDPAMLARVKRLGIELFVDVDTLKAPPESRLGTGVYFRNQNARPTAVLLPAAEQPAGRHVLANASASSDPDADRLSYRWCYFGASTPSTTVWCANGTEIPQNTVSIDYLASESVGTTVSVGLRVQDPGGLVAYDYAEVELR